MYWVMISVLDFLAIDQYQKYLQTTILHDISVLPAFFSIEVELIYNAALASGVQECDSVIYIFNIICQKCSAF